MARFPAALQCYLLTVGIAGVGMLVGMWWFQFDGRPVSLPIMGVLTGLLILFQTTPQHKIPGAKLSLGTIPIFVAAICLPVYIAVSAVIVGMVVAEFLGRRPWFETLFNGASSGIEVGLGGLVYLTLAQGHHLALTLAAIVGAVVMMRLVNVSAVAGAVSTQRGLPYGRIWRQMAQIDLGEHVLMYMAGGILAGLLDWRWLWGIVVLAAGGLLYGATLFQQRFHFARASSSTD
jgi:hypothetical protein